MHEKKEALGVGFTSLEVRDPNSPRNPSFSSLSLSLSPSLSLSNLGFGS